MRSRLVLTTALAGVLLTGLTTADATGKDSGVARAFEATTRSTTWSLVDRIPLRFPT